MLFKSVLFATVAMMLIIIFSIVMARPAKAACIVAQQNRFSEEELVLIAEAKERIENTFGSMQSRPNIQFFNESDFFLPTHLNHYGSTSFIGYKTCVSIGPNGKNVDVVAHELMHAEIVARTGLHARITKIPVWFEEGLAMQVDYREDYELPNGGDHKFVRKLPFSKEFFVDDKVELVRNYAAAKYTVGLWLEEVEAKNVYQHLETLREASSFNSIWIDVESNNDLK